ncbi:MAG: DUF4079 family protein [Nitrospinota bacterium]|nr:MAG: DUF4079 family protein [Nitrospinota bacterium]
MEWLLSKKLLPYLHPFWQGAMLALGFLTWKIGLDLRRQRLRTLTLDDRPAWVARHVRWGTRFMIGISIGYIIGVVELIYVLDELAFRSSHFYFATIAYVLFLCGWFYGYQLLQRKGKRQEMRETHTFCVTWALFISLGAAIMGFILLP